MLSHNPRRTVDIHGTRQNVVTLNLTYKDRMGAPQLFTLP